MIRRGIVVTHGVGSQRRIDQLDTVVEPLVTFLCRALGYEHVELVARTQVDETHLASAIIHLRPPQGEPEEWHVREAWWAESFRSSPSTTILPWAVGAAYFHLRATWQNVFWRNVQRTLRKDVTPMNAGMGVWEVVVAGPVRAFFDALIWLVITAGYVAAYLIGAAVIIPLYVFLLLPFALLWPAGIGRLQRGLVNVLTGGIGDQHATTNRQVAVAGAADTVVNALWYFLAPNRPGEFVYETVTLVAHSGGCVVSFDALAREDVQRWIADSPTLRRVTWVTVGSGLNLAWRMRSKTKKRDAAFWNRRLRETVNWVDIYARYDPVPQGRPPWGLVTALMGERPENVVSVRVANHDWPLTDHGAYWDNREEAMSRIVHAVADSRLGQQPLRELQGSPAQVITPDGISQPHPLVAGVQQATADAERRRQRVTAYRLGSFLLIAAALLIVFGWGPALGGWILGEPKPTFSLSRPGFDPRQAIGWLFPKQVGPIEFGAWRSWAIGILALAILVYSLGLVGRLVAHWWSWRQPEPGDQPLPPARYSAEGLAVAPGYSDSTPRAGLS